MGTCNVINCTHFVMTSCLPANVLCGDKRTAFKIQFQKYLLNKCNKTSQSNKINVYTKVNVLVVTFIKFI